MSKDSKIKKQCSQLKNLLNANKGNIWERIILLSSKQQNQFYLNWATGRGGKVTWYKAEA